MIHNSVVCDTVDANVTHDSCYDLFKKYFWYWENVYVKTHRFFIACLTAGKNKTDFFKVEKPSRCSDLKVTILDNSLSVLFERICFAHSAHGNKWVDMANTFWCSAY